jgi:hypothetical protein
MQAKTGRLMTLVTLLLAVLLFGCAAFTATRDAGGLTGLQASVEYTDDSNQVIDARYQPRQIALVFPYVPGQIFGSPGSEVLFTELVTPEGTLHLQFERALPGLQEGAATLQATATTEGLSIRPARTRFARIGTFPFDARTRKPLGEGGFIDGRTREHLILMYFDRPCVLAGTLTVGQEKYVHTISIPVAGFHLLRVEQQGPRHHVLSRAEDPSGIIFSIHLLDLQQTCTRCAPPDTGIASRG